MFRLIARWRAVRRCSFVVAGHLRPRRQTPGVLNPQHFSRGVDSFGRAMARRSTFVVVRSSLGSLGISASGVCGLPGRFEEALAEMERHGEGFTPGLSCGLFGQRGDFIRSISYPSSVSIRHCELGRILTSSDCHDLVSINKKNARLRSRVVRLAKSNQCHIRVPPSTKCAQPEFPFCHPGQHRFYIPSRSGNVRRGELWLTPPAYGRYTAELVSVSQTFTSATVTGLSVSNPSLMRS